MDKKPPLDPDPELAYLVRHGYLQDADDTSYTPTAEEEADNAELEEMMAARRGIAITYRPDKKLITVQAGELSIPQAEQAITDLYVALAMAKLTAGVQA